MVLRIEGLEIVSRNPYIYYRDTRLYSLLLLITRILRFTILREGDPCSLPLFSLFVLRGKRVCDEKGTVPFSFHLSTFNTV